MVPIKVPARRPLCRDWTQAKRRITHDALRAPDRMCFVAPTRICQHLRAQFPRYARVGPECRPVACYRSAFQRPSKRDVCWLRRDTAVR